MHSKVSQFKNISGEYFAKVFSTPNLISTKLESWSYLLQYNTLFIILSIKAMILPDLYEIYGSHSFGISDEICFAVYVTKSVVTKLSKV